MTVKLQELIEWYANKMVAYPADTSDVTLAEDGWMSVGIRDVMKYQGKYQLLAFQLEVRQKQMMANGLTQQLR